MWVVVAEKYAPRTYRLSYTFIVDGVKAVEEHGPPFLVYGRDGDSFEPEIPLTNLAWFRRLYDLQNNFSYGFSIIDDESAEQFERLRRARCSHS